MSCEHVKILQQLTNINFLSNPIGARVPQPTSDANIKCGWFGLSWKDGPRWIPEADILELNALDAASAVLSAVVAAFGAQPWVS